jgi:hypothetical protein
MLFWANGALAAFPAGHASMLVEEDTDHGVTA